MNTKKILFFINGTFPSEEDFREASKLNGRVCFRNAKFIDETGTIEQCDFVAGAIPRSYSEIAKVENEVNSEETEMEVENEHIDTDCNIALKQTNLLPVWKPN